MVYVIIYIFCNVDIKRWFLKFFSILLFQPLSSCDFNFNISSTFFKTLMNISWRTKVSLNFQPCYHFCRSWWLIHHFVLIQSFFFIDFFLTWSCYFSILSSIPMCTFPLLKSTTFFKINNFRKNASTTLQEIVSAKFPKVNLEMGFQQILFHFSNSLFLLGYPFNLCTHPVEEP